MGREWKGANGRHLLVHPLMRAPHNPQGRRLKSQKEKLRQPVSLSLIIKERFASKEPISGPGLPLPHPPLILHS